MPNALRLKFQLRVGTNCILTVTAPDPDEEAAGKEVEAAVRDLFRRTREARQAGRDVDEVALQADLDAQHAKMRELLLAQIVALEVDGHDVADWRPVVESFGLTRGDLLTQVFGHTFFRRTIPVQVVDLR